MRDQYVIPTHRAFVLRLWGSKFDTAEDGCAVYREHNWGATMETGFVKPVAVAIVSVLAAVPALAQQGGPPPRAGPPFAVPALGTSTVDCAAGESIQAAVDSASGAKTIFVSGTCAEDVTITKDDITLSGNQAGAACDKANPGGTGTIDGSITVDGVRARIEFLTITGPGFGVEITARASAEIECNDISFNEKYGANVEHSSYASLVDNTFAENGQRDISANDPSRNFDCGLFVLWVSSVLSKGNTYTGNSYCGVESDHQSSFRNGSFIPSRPGFAPDPAEKDIIIQRGCAPLDVSGCDASAFGVFNRVAISSFSNGLVDLRHAEVTGLIDTSASSLFRMDTIGILVGDISNLAGGNVRIRNPNLDNGRTVSFTGLLQCDADSSTYFSSVSCGQTCQGLDANGDLICQ